MENKFGLKSRKNMIMAVMTVGLASVFVCTQVPTTMAAIGDPACSATTAQNVLDIFNLCVLPVAPSLGQTSDCCTAAKNFDFSCSCSPVVVSLVKMNNLVAFRDLLAKANYCNTVTVREGLKCLGARTP